MYFTFRAFFYKVGCKARERAQEEAAALKAGDKPAAEAAAKAAKAARRRSVADLNRQTALAAPRLRARLSLPRRLIGKAFPHDEVLRGAVAHALPAPRISS